MLASAGLRGFAAVILLAVHIIAMAAAAKYFDDAFEGSSDISANSNRGLLYNAVWNIVGFLFAAGFGLFELFTLNSGDKDTSASFGLGCTLLSSGLIELGFAAKAADLSQDGVVDTYKAMEGFGIIAGGFSMFVFLLKVAGRFTSSATA